MRAFCGLTFGPHERKCKPLTQTKAYQMNLIIANKKIRIKDGLYCLNDLHKASGAEKKNGPSYFTATKTFNDLVLELCNADPEIPVSNFAVMVKGGKGQGTYACKELVYAYAMWISPEFHLYVIRAYDALVTGQLEELQRQQSRQNAKLEAKFLTDAINYDKKGKAAHYHFSNEFNLINKIVLGMNAKQYRIENGIEPNQSIRDTLTKSEIAAIEHMQRLDTGMIELGYSYEQRKSELSRVFLTRHNKALCAEVKRLES